MENTAATQAPTTTYRTIKSNSMTVDEFLKAADHAYHTNGMGQDYSAPIGPRNDLGVKLASHIERFIAFSNPTHSRVLALWALHTHVFDAFRQTPYIYVSSIDPGAGKTTLMEVMRDVVRDADLTANSSAAAMFRKLADRTPTIILDEVDTLYSGGKGDQDMRNVLNSGYDYKGTVERFTGKETEVFPTFCPKFLGGIDNGALPHTVMDRSIRIRLRKLSGDQLLALNIEEYDVEELEDEGTLEVLHAELAEWATIDRAQAIKETDVKSIRPEGLSARQWQLIRPLLRIAKHLGWGDDTADMLAAIFQGESNETPEVAMLRKVRDLFEDTGADRLPASELAAVTGYDAQRMGRILSGWDVRSKPMKIAGSTVRGYYKVELEDAFARFLS